MLIAIATLLAIGLDPLVNLITRRGVRRGAGVAIVFLGLLAVIAAAIYAIIPPIVNEVGSFVSTVPRTDHRTCRTNPNIQNLDQKFGVLEALRNSNIVQNLGSGAAGGLLTASFTVAAVLRRPADHPGADAVLAGRASRRSRRPPTGWCRPPAGPGSPTWATGSSSRWAATCRARRSSPSRPGWSPASSRPSSGLPYPWAIGLAAAVLDFIPVVGPITVGGRDDVARVHPGRGDRRSSRASSTWPSTCSRRTGSTRG